MPVAAARWGALASAGLRAYFCVHLDWALHQVLTEVLPRGLAGSLLARAIRLLVGARVAQRAPTAAAREQPRVQGPVCQLPGQQGGAAP